MSDVPLSRSGKSALAMASDVVTEAGDLLVQRSQSIGEVSLKGRGNVVTDVDRQSEALIISRLLDEFPGYGILAEESGASSSGSEYSWVIDPLDGTKNYSMGLPLYCVTVALARGSDVLVGATFDPLRRELFVAQRSGGAFLNGRRLHVARQAGLSESLVFADMGYHDLLGHYALRMWDDVWPGVQGLRIMGSSALGLAYLACGRVDLLVHHSLYPWDIAAGILLVQEAGGIVTNRRGQPIDFLRDPSIVASNADIHRDFMRRTDGLEWRQA